VNVFTRFDVTREDPIDARDGYPRDKETVVTDDPAWQQFDL
jgi:hypothetical protein